MLRLVDLGEDFWNTPSSELELIQESLCEFLLKFLILSREVKNEVLFFMAMRLNLKDIVRV